MNRSRVRERERLRRPVDTTDPVGLAAYADELRPVVAGLRLLAEVATDRPAARVHNRAFLRGTMLRHIRELKARIDDAAPPPAT